MEYRRNPGISAVLYPVVLVALAFSMTLVFRYFSDSVDRPRPKPTDFSLEVCSEAENLVPMLVLGSGPAGLSAALYCVRGGVKSIVVEGGMPGGQLTGTTYVENWPSRKKILGPKIMEEFREQARDFGVEFLENKVKRVDFSKWPYELWLDDGVRLNAMSVIIATGATPRKLGVSGEDEYWGRGVSTCAICDAAYYKGKDVMVVGGGDSAVEQARQIADYARLVTVMVRKDKMRAAESLQASLKGYHNIVVRYNVNLKSIGGNGEKVTQTEVYNNLTGETNTVPIDGVFLAIGLVPNSSPFVGALDMSKEGYIKIGGRGQQTSVPGVFAAGDVEDEKYRQAGVAAGRGIVAGLEAMAFLREIGITPQILSELEPNFFEEVDVEHFEIPEISTMHELEAAAAKFDGPIILDVYMESCPACVQMFPILRSLAPKLKGIAKLYAVNASANAEIPIKFHIPKAPCFLVYKDGKELGRRYGVVSKHEFYKWVKELARE